MYRPKQERKFCFVIRGLHPSVENDKINKELFTHDYEVYQIINLQKKKYNTIKKLTSKLPLVQN